MYSTLQKSNEIVTVMSRILQNIVIEVQFETSKGLNSGGLNVVQLLMSKIITPQKQQQQYSSVPFLHC